MYFDIYGIYDINENQKDLNEIEKDKEKEEEETNIIVINWIKNENSNNKNTNNIASAFNISTLKINNVVNISPNTNKELILRVGLMLQHLGIDIQRLVETSYGYQKYYY